MATQRHLVLTRPPEGVSEEEFNQWYEIHLREVLSFPGFISAERFHVELKRSISGETFPFTYAALYELEGNHAEVWGSMRRAEEAGDLTTPDWTARLTHVGLHLIPVGEPVTAD